MRNRRIRALIILAGFVATPATASALVPMTGSSVTLPGVRGIQAVRVCTDAAGEPICEKVSTPRLRSGRVSAHWDRGLDANVAATPVSPFPSECHGRPGAKIDASVARVAANITLSVDASYLGARAPRTLISVDRSVGVDKSAAIWACLL
jgi:hypothetical protein